MTLWEAQSANYLEAALASNAPYLLTPTTVRMAATPDLQERARILLDQQAQGPQASAGVQPATAPDAQMYGVFGPQYAASLARPTDSASEHIFNRATLRNGAEQERADYGLALERAQRGAMDRIDREGMYGLMNTEMNTGARPVLSRTRSIGRASPDEPYGIIYNEPVANLSDQLVGDKILAETRGQSAGAIGELYRSGHRVPEGTAEAWMTGAGQETPDDLTSFDPSGYNPGDQNSKERIPIEWFDANSRRISAEADKYRAEHPTDAQGYTTYQYTPDANGTIQADHVPLQRGGSGGGATPTAGGTNDNTEAGYIDSWQPTAGGPSQRQGAIAQRAQQAGGRTGMQNGILVVVDPRGNSYMYGQDGQRIQQGRGGGRPASSPRTNNAGRQHGDVLARVRATEGPESLGGYNAIAFNSSRTRNQYGVPQANLSNMTMGQVHDYQLQVIRPRTRGHPTRHDPRGVGSTGVGAYGFESRTLEQMGREVFGADWRNQPFSPANQDRMAMRLFQQYGLSPWYIGGTGGRPRRRNRG